MKRFVSIVFSVSLMVIMLFSSIDLLVYGIRGYIPYEYEKYNVYGITGCSREEMEQVTEQMMDYLRGDCETLNDDGFFDQRETAHMADVRLLFLGGLKIRRICIIICILAVIILICSKTGDILTELCAGYLIGTPVFIGTLGFLGVIFSRDFEKYFIMFHKIFFDNDLWLLDPDTSKLINMVPEGFFMDTVKYILIIFGAGICILAALAAWRVIYKKRKKKKYRKNR